MKDSLRAWRQWKWSSASEDEAVMLCGEALSVISELAMVVPGFRGVDWIGQGCASADRVRYGQADRLVSPESQWAEGN